MRLLHLALFLLPLLVLAASPARAATATPAGGPAPAGPDPTATSAVSISLGTAGNFERKTVKYGCQGRDNPFSVDYVNAAPNFLALLQVDEGTLVFSTVLAASGAKYASG